jgi:pimeloyl-ACP methyl ester carboxylesterase
MAHGVTLTRCDGIPDYAERFAAAGFVALAFDYRHWGDSEGEPRRWVSLRRQLEDWRAAVAYVRTLEGVDQERVAVWGMSLGGGHALLTAAADRRVAAVVALAPMTDGVAICLKPSPPNVALRSTWRAVREAITRRPVTMPVAGPPRAFAALDAPEALPGFRRLAATHGWRNEVNAGAALGLLRYRPVRRASRIQAPVLLQVGERDEMAPLPPIEKSAARAPRSELIRYPIDHFGCFWPEHIDRVVDDELDFLRRHLLASDPRAR